MAAAWICHPQVKLRHAPRVSGLHAFLVLPSIESKGKPIPPVRWDIWDTLRFFSVFSNWGNELRPEWQAPSAWSQMPITVWIRVKYRASMVRSDPKVILVLNDKPQIISKLTHTEDSSSVFNKSVVYIVCVSDILQFCHTLSYMCFIISFKIFLDAWIWLYGLYVYLLWAWPFSPSLQVVTMETRMCFQCWIASLAFP